MSKSTANPTDDSPATTAGTADPPVTPSPAAATTGESEATDASARSAAGDSAAKPPARGKDKREPTGSPAKPGKPSKPSAADASRKGPTKAARRTPGKRTSARAGTGRQKQATGGKASGGQTAAVAGDGKQPKLRPGELDGLVLEFLKDNASTGSHSPTSVARGLNRSSGAVANCLDRLKAAKQVRQVGEKPRRYKIAA